MVVRFLLSAFKNDSLLVFTKSEALSKKPHLPLIASFKRGGRQTWA